MTQKIQKCEFCELYKPAKEFFNGHNEPITWCKACGMSMINALQL